MMTKINTLLFVLLIHLVFNAYGADLKIVGGDGRFYYAEITTERLIIRSISFDDANFIAKLYQKSENRLLSKLA